MDMFLLSVCDSNYTDNSNLMCNVSVYMKQFSLSNIIKLSNFLHTSKNELLCNVIKLKYMYSFA